FDLVEWPAGERRVFLDRFFDVENGRQLIVLDRDQLDRLLRYFDRVGRDGGDGLTVEIDLPVGEHNVSPDGRVPIGRRQVRGGYDCLHALQRFGGAGVDAQNTCMGEGAA